MDETDAKARDLGYLLTVQPRVPLTETSAFHATDAKTKLASRERSCSCSRRIRSGGPCSVGNRLDCDRASKKISDVIRLDDSECNSANSVADVDFIVPGRDEIRIYAISRDHWVRRWYCIPDSSVVSIGTAADCRDDWPGVTSSRFQVAHRAAATVFVDKLP